MKTFDTAIELEEIDVRISHTIQHAALEQSQLSGGFLMRVKECLLAVVVLCVCGCVNPYAKYYTDLTQGEPYVNQPNYEFSDNVKVFGSDNQQDDAIKLLEDGFVCIGTSAFYAKDLSTERAIAQARDVKASVVLISKTYRNTESGVVPLTLPTSQTSYNSFSGNAYGTSGNTSFSGSGTTTTYGTQTTYLPYSNTFYNYAATFWIKQKTARLGARFRDLNDNEKKSLGSNKGVVITAVVKGGAAYEADILKGDIVKSVDGTPIQDTQSFRGALAQREGAQVTFSILRDDKEMTKQVKLRRLPAAAAAK